MRDRPSQGPRGARRTVALADRGDHLARCQGRARLVLAETLRAAGRDEDAVAAAREALDGWVLLADQARALLAEIGSPA